MTRPAAWPPLLLLALLVPAAVAQNAAPTAEQYQDALKNLKALQDSKEKLSTENQTQHQTIVDLQKKLAETGDRLSTLQGHVYDLRAQFEAWRQFIDANPRLKAMWLAFYSGPSIDRTQALLGDGRWPFSVEG